MEHEPFTVHPGFGILRSLTLRLFAAGRFLKLRDERDEEDSKEGDYPCSRVKKMARIHRNMGEEHLHSQKLVDIGFVQYTTRIVEAQGIPG